MWRQNSPLELELMVLLRNVAVLEKLINPMPNQIPKLTTENQINKPIIQLSVKLHGC